MKIHKNSQHSLKMMRKVRIMNLRDNLMEESDLLNVKLLKKL